MSHHHYLHTMSSLHHRPVTTQTTLITNGFMRKKDDEQKQNRLYHSSAPSERVVAMMMGLGTLSALAYAGASAAKSYEEWKAAQPTPEQVEEMKKEAEEEMERQKKETDFAQANAAAEDPKKAGGAGGSTDDAPRENFFKKFFDVGTKYYEGGFEEAMTKREAALILGVRESASPQKIKDAHRKLLILNHPDTGGSTYISLKINQAKELLLKGKAKM